MKNQQQSFLLWNKLDSIQQIEQIPKKSITSRHNKIRNSDQLYFHRALNLKEVQDSRQGMRGSADNLFQHFKSFESPMKEVSLVQPQSDTIRLSLNVEDNNQQQSNKKRLIYGLIDTQSSQIFSQKYGEYSPINMPTLMRQPSLLKRKRSIKHILNDYKYVKSQVELGLFTTRNYDRFFKPNKMIGKNSHQHLYRADIEKLKINDPNFKLIIYNYFLNSPDTNINKQIAIQNLKKQMVENRSDEKYLTIMKFLKYLALNGESIIS